MPIPEPFPSDRLFEDDNYLILVLEDDPFLSSYLSILLATDP